jgi:tetratricopeptide (TPR) repeat protein
MEEMAALQSRFRQGLALHRQSDLAAAERVYLEILDSEPGHFDALHMLGVVALQTRRAERGIELIEQAVGPNAKVASAHNNLGKALLDLKRPDQALSSFDRAIALDPRGDGSCGTWPLAGHPRRVPADPWSGGYRPGSNFDRAQTGLHGILAGEVGSNAQA